MCIAGGEAEPDKLRIERRLEDCGVIYIVLVNTEKSHWNVATQSKNNLVSELNTPSYQYKEQSIWRECHINCTFDLT